MSRTLAPISGDTLPAIRRLWREWMRPHRGELAAVAGLVVLVAGTTGLYPVLIKAAFDAFSAKDERAIMLAPLLVVAVTAVKGFSLLGLTVLTNRVGSVRVSAITQTPASGPFAPATTPPMSSPSTVTAGFAPPWPEMTIASDDRRMVARATVVVRP